MVSERSRVRTSLVLFAALALYGTMRWATMLARRDQRGILETLLLAIAVAAGIRALEHIPRLRLPALWVVLLALAGVLGMLVAAGIPVSWLTGLHTGRIANTLSDGASQLSSVTLPYQGTDRGIVAVMILGAGALLLCGALAFGSALVSPATGRLAVAALPLLAMAVVPSAILRPHVAYLHGALSFTLASALVLSPRVAPGRRGAAFMLLTVVGVLGVTGAALLGSRRAWFAGPAVQVTGAPGTAHGGESFNWEQTYGALGPRAGTEVLEVSAPRSAYWKSEDLDSFNGRGWVLGGSGGGDGVEGVPAARQSADSEVLSVEVGHMVSRQLIGAGQAADPRLVGSTAGAAPGTWVISPPLHDGLVYRIQVDVPDPSAAQLAAAGRRYPAALAPLRNVGLAASPVYRPVRALAAALAVGHPTPYAYMEAAVTYLRDHETYTVRPPAPGRHPLVSFLTESHRGYCQQFAGALALLLRMNGIPARVAVGFTSGTLEPGTDTYLVTDRDAHAWDEVFFPGYGWVTVDPTPGALAVTRSVSSPGVGDAGLAPPLRAGSHALGARPRGAGRPSAGHGTAGARRSGAGSPLGWVLAAVGLVAVLLGLGYLLRRRAARATPSAEALVAELELAFSRCGEPLGNALTLDALARQLAASPAAARYVRALAIARFGPGDGPAPSSAGRVALRRWLGRAGTPRHRLRALRALPPRRLSPRRGH